jgi:hypothetical protein
MEIYSMLLAVFIPLFTSWIFRRKKWQVALTYIFSCMAVVLLLVMYMILNVIFIFSKTGAPDTIAIASGSSHFIGYLAIDLAVTAFFQFVFNRTFGLSKS